MKEAEFNWFINIIEFEDALKNKRERDKNYEEFNDSTFMVVLFLNFVIVALSFLK